MSELTQLIEKTANGVFQDGVNPDNLRDLEEAQLDREMWQAIEEAGLTKVLVKEEAGGAGGSWLDAEVVLRAAGRHCVPAPLAEAIVANWLLDLAGLPVTESALLTWSPGKIEGTTIVLNNVPWAAQADNTLVWADDGTLYLFGAIGGLTEGKNIASEPRADGTIDIDQALCRAPIPQQLANLDPNALGALVRSVQMSGALGGALQMSVNYATERVQFGKPIAKFQAIQQQLAQMSGHVATAVRAAGAGCEALAKDPTTAAFDIAVAKVVNSDSVEIATSVAHQVHAAIGITFEYRLNFYSRRLWAWREEYGATAYWAEQLGSAATQIGGDALWQHVTDNSLRL